MNLVLVENIIKVSSERLNDDALKLWFESKDESKYKCSPAAWYSRNDIGEGEKYLEVNIMDEETAELTFLNVSIMMHKAMVRYGIYPLFILKMFVK